MSIVSLWFITVNTDHTVKLFQALVGRTKLRYGTPILKYGMFTETRVVDNPNHTVPICTNVQYYYCCHCHSLFPPGGHKMVVAVVVVLLLSFLVIPGWAYTHKQFLEWLKRFFYRLNDQSTVSKQRRYKNIKMEIYKKFSKFKKTASYNKQHHTIQIRHRGTSVVFNWRSRSNTFVLRLCMIVSGLKLHTKWN